MKTINTLLILFMTLLAPHTFAFPFAPAAGQPGSTAVSMNDAAFVAWADGYTNMLYGANVDANWQTPNKALGQAVGTSYDIVCLGRGGQITLTFSQGIGNGIGNDFAVFENSFSDTFLELGWVEVSSDGIHFTRFPNYSFTASPVSGFGGIDPTYITGLASKYKQGYGTPFDLAELQTAYDSIVGGTHSFANGYAEAFTNNFPYLDLADIGYVRIVDIVGDSSAFDAGGYVIYDPYPTTGSAGLDIDAIGVINQPTPEGLQQTITFDSIPHQKRAFGSVALNASSSSGLSVSFSIQSGSASISNNTLFFAATGTVEVVAHQLGDATYAPAAPVLHSFEVAEEIQHIFIETIPNQITGSGKVQIKAYSSQGLPVKMQVHAGPADVLIDEETHLLDLGNNAGAVTLRAYQPGNGTTAPATDILMEFQLLPSHAATAPLTLAQWAAKHSVPANGLSDSDNDGVIDFQEFAMGGDPNLGTSVPLPTIGHSIDPYGQPVATIEYTISRNALGQSRLNGSADLSVWTNTVPEIIEMQSDQDFIHLKVQLPADVPQYYYRLIFEEQ